MLKPLGGRNALAVKVAKYYAVRSMSVVRDAAERIIGAVAEGNSLRAQMAIFRRLTGHDPINTVLIGREIASRAGANRPVHHRRLRRLILLQC